MYDSIPNSLDNVLKNMTLYRTLQILDFVVYQEKKQQQQKFSIVLNSQTLIQFLNH